MERRTSQRKSPSESGVVVLGRNHGKDGATTGLTGSSAPALEKPRTTSGQSTTGNAKATYNMAFAADFLLSFQTSLLNTSMEANKESYKTLNLEQQTVFKKRQETMKQYYSEKAKGDTCGFYGHILKSFEALFSKGDLNTALDELGKGFTEDPVNGVITVVALGAGCELLLIPSVISDSYIQSKIKDDFVGAGMDKDTAGYVTMGISIGASVTEAIILAAVGIALTAATAGTGAPAAAVFLGSAALTTAEVAQSAWSTYKGLDSGLASSNALNLSAQADKLTAQADQLDALQQKQLNAMKDVLKTYQSNYDSIFQLAQNMGDSQAVIANA